MSEPGPVVAPPGRVLDVGRRQDDLVLLTTSSMRARRNPRAVAILWAWQTALALLAAWPAAGLVRAAWAGDVAGDAPLWAPGGHALADWMWHDAHGLRAVVGLAEAVLIAGAVIGIVPATALMIEIAYVTRGRPHAGLLRSFSGGVRSLPSMLLLLVLSGLAQALLLGIGAGVAHLVEQVAHGRLGEAAAGVLQGAVLAAAAALASVAGVAHDLGRASIVRFEVRGWSAFGLGWRTLRIAPLTIWWSWAWRGGAGVVLVLLASVVAERIGGRGGVALLVLAVLHQAVVAARVALRASWLAGALRAVDGRLRRATP